MKIKKISIVLAVAAYCFATAVVFFPIERNEKLEAGATPAFNYTIVIDAGHGGIDGGAVGVNGGVSESDVNLAVALLSEDLFKKGGFKVVMTRSSAGGLYGLPTAGFKKRDMKKRAEIIAESSPTIVLSVHQNSCVSPSRRGTMVYYAYGNGDGLALADAICASVNEMPEKPRDCVRMPGDFFILNVSACPSVIVECGFLSNAEDELLLCDDEYREKLAYALYRGVVNYFVAQEGV